MLSLLSCQKSVENWIIPDDFQGWCRFREGSYWIYRNEKTFKLDCTYVTGFSSGTRAHYDSDVVRWYYDWERSDIRGYFISGIFTESTGIGEAEMTFGPVYLSTWLLADPVYQNPWYPGQSGSGVVTVFPTEVVNGNTFQNVYQCRVANQLWDGDSVIIDGHLAKNVGMVKYVKRVDQADTTWTLVKWHVNQ